LVLPRRNFLYSIGATALAFSSCEIAAEAKQGELLTDEPILLNRNENAYGTSPNIRTAMQSLLRFCNRFPDDGYNFALQGIAAFHTVKPSQVLIGCGSTDIMRMCAHAFLTPGTRFITADPTFSFLQDYAAHLGTEVVRVPLNHRYEHDLNTMLSHAGRSRNFFYICNPNNPTGTITPSENLEKFFANLPSETHVLIDEAYHHYAGGSEEYVSWLERAATDPRLIVTRTFSKVYGLAGMRVGYAVATESTIRRLIPFQLWSGVNRAAALASTIALKDTAFVQLAVKRNADARQEFFNTC